MAPEFVVLGEIGLRTGGQPADIGHLRQRCVLAALVLDANRVVLTEQLIDRIWADTPPHNARNTLYVYLSRLRKLVHDAGSGRLLRKAGGYVLSVEPDAVDAHRFRALLDQARTAGDQTAASLLEEALGLWRGEPFAGADTPWFTAQRDSLTGERFAAQLDLADILLRRGDHNRLLSELAARAAAYPLNERAAGQLILALHRCGRTSDALTHYRATRKVLADELGIEPDPTLRHLHERILAADPGLTMLTTVRPPAARPSVPRQLPRAPGLFSGRTDALTKLTDALSVAQPSRTVVVSAISGTGGIGKTYLALHWAHEHLGDFPDGQLYVNLRGFAPSGTPTTPEAAVRGFLDALAVDPAAVPAGLDAQAALYRSLVADRRMLIVLDNARDTDQVIPLLPGGSSCAVLVTSRRHLAGLFTGYSAQLLTLDFLDQAEARELLTRKLGAARTAAEPQAVTDLLDHCAGLPLALSIVAARAAMHPNFALATLAKELSTDSARLDALDAGESMANLRLVFSWSYQPLSPAAARLFRLMGGSHPGPDITESAAASLVGGAARGLLGELLNAHLVIEHAPGRFTMHDLVRTYAAELIGPAEQREATRRMLDHYLLSAHAAEKVLAPYRDQIPLLEPSPGVQAERFTDLDETITWVAAEYPVLRAALTRAAETNFTTHTWQLAWTLTTYLERRGHSQEKVAVQTIALAAAEQQSDAVGQAEAHRGLGRAYSDSGRPQDALPHFQRALQLSIALGDASGQAHTHVQLARVVATDNRWAEAAEHSHRSLALYRSAGHRIGEARALNSIGWCLIRLGDYRQALTYCQQALARQTELGDVLNVAATLDSLAYAHHHLGDHQQAVAYYQRALDMYADMGNLASQARTGDRLGDAQHAAGDIPAAIRSWQHAVAIHEELGHRDADRIRAKLMS